MASLLGQLPQTQSVTPDLLQIGCQEDRCGRGGAGWDGKKSRCNFMRAGGALGLIPREQWRESCPRKLVWAALGCTAFQPHQSTWPRAILGCTPSHCCISGPPSTQQSPGTSPKTSHWEQKRRGEEHTHPWTPGWTTTGGCSPSSAGTYEGTATRISSHAQPMCAKLTSDMSVFSIPEPR